MQYLVIRLGAALVTFALGLGASAVWGALRPAMKAGSQVRSCAALRSASELVLVGTEAAPRPNPAAGTIRGGILQNKATSKPMPAYPAVAKAARASGAVVVEIVVGEEGDVISADAVSGHPLLRQAAVDAVRQWRFSPTRLNGQPVKVSGQVTVNFVLD